MAPTLFEDAGDDWHEWLAAILCDLDIEFLLFAPGVALTPDVTYHFDHWDKVQFYAGGDTTTEPLAQRSEP